MPISTQTRQAVMPKEEKIWLTVGIGLILVLLVIILLRLSAPERPTVAPFGKVIDIPGAAGASLDWLPPEQEAAVRALRSN